MTFRRVLIAVDSEPVAAHAADVGIELARSLAAEIAFVHVVDPKNDSHPEGGVVASELAGRAQADARKLLAVFSGHLPGELKALEFVRTGEAATEIINTAKQWEADFIVIGTHGRCGIKRAILGSVAEKVMRHAPCPVVAVRARC
ncbi:MAG TPA: universal stress protein [Terriglobales bacterium]|nr:universal stress protein [Terriglobales bacterium]